MLKIKRTGAVAIGFVVIIFPISARDDVCATCKAYWQAEDAGMTVDVARYGATCTWTAKQMCRWKAMVGR